MDTCHDRHLDAEKVLAVIRKPALLLADRNTLDDLLTKIGDSQPMCGEFGRWWTSRLFEEVQHARDETDAFLLGGLVLKWFEFTKKLLVASDDYCPIFPLTRQVPEQERLDDHFRHCARFRRIDSAEWTRMFISGVRSNPASAEALVLHLTTFLDFLDESQAADCARAVAAQAERVPRLRLKFLSLAYFYAKAFSWNAHALVNEALLVAGKDPVELLHQLGEYLGAIPIGSGTIDTLLVAHKAIHEWVCAQEKAGELEAVARMRRYQEKFVFHLQGRPPRCTHHATPDRQVTARVIQRLEGNAAVEIEGIVADVSVGRDTTGRGIRILLPGCQVAAGAHQRDTSWGDSALHLNTFGVHTEKQTLEIRDPDVEIRWENKMFRSETYSIRAVDSAPEPFCVLFLTKRDGEFSAWANYARDLPPVDYGFARGPT